MGIRGTLALGILFHLEGMPAAARRGGIRVVDLEARLLQSGQEVDRGALEVRDTEGIDDDVDPFELELEVALRRLRVEAEAVLEAGAAAAWIATRNTIVSPSGSSAISSRIFVAAVGVIESRVSVGRSWISM